MQLPCTWDAPRPYVHPLTTPAGAVLSVEAPADHPWHHALWFTIKFVNGENFWEEYGEFGRLHTTGVETSADGTVRAAIEWIAPDGTSVRAHETRTISTTELAPDSYAIDWTETLTVVDETVFDRTPFTTWGGYGGLTLRGAPTWTDTSITLDDDVARGRTLGERSTWLAIEGVAAETDAPAGVLVLDHADNPRSPTPWYASTRADTYGEGWANFVNAAFLWDEPLTVPAGGALHLRYRVVVHDGAWDLDRVRAERERWPS
ncbi:MAG: DUF6807 domain-containing protein [Acidimicrobiia bacterium]